MTSINRLTAILGAVTMAAALGCVAAPKFEGTGESAVDAAITTKVKAALFREPALTTEIKVETFEGIVRLSGFVRSQEDIDRAVVVAGQVAGVKSVKNEMRLE